MGVPAETSPLRFRWRPYLALVLVLCSLFLLASWSLPLGRSWWDAVDLAVFNALNGSLSDDPASAWNHLWALVNVRWADLFTGAIMAGILLTPGAVFPHGRVLRGFIGFVLMLLILLMMREGVGAYAKALDLNHVAPTLVLDHAIRLSELYPELGTKDAAWHTFPGDHAAVLLLWMGYCLAMQRNAWTALIVVVSVLFQLPRLVSGAHWLSDELVGGAAIAGLSLALGLCTPLLNRPLDGLDRFLSRLWARWVAPLVGRLRSG